MSLVPSEKQLFVVRQQAHGAASAPRIRREAITVRLRLFGISGHALLLLE
jgi:hypothetical protein